MAELKVRLTGKNARLGDIPASDVAQLLLGVERALARSVATLLGRQVKRGRREKIVAEASRVRLTEITKGSVGATFKVPTLRSEEGDTFDIDVSTLAEEAVERLIDEICGKGTPDKRLSRSLEADLGAKLQIGLKYERLEFAYRQSGKRARTARLDISTRERLRLNAGMVSEVKESSVSGLLFEVDFERHSAKLRTPEGEEVAVTFSPDWDDRIQAALRDQALFEGEVEYDPLALVVKSVKVKELNPARQLAAALDPHAFWRFESFQQLARHQNITPIFDPDEVFDAEATEEERAAFADALHEVQQ